MKKHSNLWISIVFIAMMLLVAVVIMPEKVAAYSKIGYYYISFQAGRSDVSNIPASFEIKDGAVYAIPTQKPIRTGYDFLGWSTVNNASSKEYSAGEKMYASKSLTLYPVWKKAASSGITTNNYGVCGDYPVSKAAQKNKAISMSANYDKGKNAGSFNYQLWAVHDQGISYYTYDVSGKGFTKDMVTMTWTDRTDVRDAKMLEAFSMKPNNANKDYKNTGVNGSVNMYKLNPGKYTLTIYGVANNGNKFKVGVISFRIRSNHYGVCTNSPKAISPSVDTCGIIEMNVEDTIKNLPINGWGVHDEGITGYDCKILEGDGFKKEYVTIKAQNWPESLDGVRRDLQVALNDIGTTEKNTRFIGSIDISKLAVNKKYTVMIVGKTETGNTFNVSKITFTKKKYCDMHGHQGNGYTFIDPTCTSDGYKVVKCVNCGKEISRSVWKKATGHSWGDWTVTKDPTCTTNGEKVHKCTRAGCGASQTSSITKLGHTFGCCIQEGSHPKQHEAYCTRCQKTIYKDHDCNDLYLVKRFSRTEITFDNGDDNYDGIHLYMCKDSELNTDDLYMRCGKYTLSSCSECVTDWTYYTDEYTTIEKTSSGKKLEVQHDVYARAGTCPVCNSYVVNYMIYSPENRLTRSQIKSELLFTALGLIPFPTPVTAYAVDAPGNIVTIEDLKNRVDHEKENANYDLSHVKLETNAETIDKIIRKFNGSDPLYNRYDVVTLPQNNQIKFITEDELFNLKWYRKVSPTRFYEPYNPPFSDYGYSMIHLKQA